MFGQATRDYTSTATQSIPNSATFSEGTQNAAKDMDEFLDQPRGTDLCFI